MIEFYNEDIDLPTINPKIIISWITNIIIRHNKEVGDVSFIFCSDNYLLQINREHLNHNYFTDIITFEYNELNIISGDIFISIDTVLENSKEYQVLFSNELNRVMIHGILHLLGFNDKTDEEQFIMTQKEDEALNIFAL